LDRWHIPKGVTGGIPLCIAFYLITKYTGKSFVFDNELRDFFLLFFFCTTGMLINFNELLESGKVLFKLVFVLFVFLVLQNVVGVTSAMLLGRNLVDGLIIGTITLAGGHGTGISWGTHLEELGYKGSLNLALLSATLGLISGAMAGGPVASRLIRKYNLGVKKKSQGEKTSKDENFSTIVSSTSLFLKTILLVLLIIVIGCAFNKLLYSNGIVCPDYLPTMFLAAILIIFANKYTKKSIDKEKVGLLNNVSLQIFISMTIMAINIGFIFDTQVLEVLYILFFQVVLIVLYAKFVFFKFGGKDYDSAVLTSGFIGSGLGATPVGLANMEMVTKKYGMSYKAFLILPLLGSVFTDLMNAIIVSFFLNFIS
jgi:ESS family glutamate:Na+ symporter